MHFSLLTLSTLLLLGPTAAVNIIWIEPNHTCGGPSFWTIYDAANAQCYVTGTYARSVSFQNIPSGAKGQVYTSFGCTDYWSEAGSGTHCLAAPQWTGLHAANWFYPFKKLVRKRDADDVRPRFGVTYTLPDGTEREVEVAALQDVENTLQMVKEKDYEGLAALPDMVMVGTSEV